MSPSIQEIYAKALLTLSPFERLQLVTLILNNLTQQDAAVVDDSDTWTDQDQLDLSAYSLQYAATVCPDGEEIAE
ncbi:MAG: hypothetical protein HC838_00220 [Spirulinaceae cyanobacterium RM2_2_10]|nr:hypothetical protein [Spirulinaceae cyanobacterium SM2_1_0]NJO18793.1 hypothetical protein [Spirulinaceae cyanobacterium RM2_2_10]